MHFRDTMLTKVNTNDPRMKIGFMWKIHGMATVGTNVEREGH
jgi:hypothetical protein